MDIDEVALDETLRVLKERLMRARLPEGCWQGRLSGSALSSATAVFALSVVDRAKYDLLIRKGLDWLIENQNCDGGWGDTVSSLSNISTTMLCWSALAIAGQSNRYAEAVAEAESRLVDFAGSLEPGALTEAVDKQYGRDRSFSAPILTMCALAGRLGDPERAWQRIKPLPFELAMLPHTLFKWLRLPVVSYALPALIAIGQAGYHHRRPMNPAARVVRCLSRRRTLEVLRRIQPENGGFLEAAPLTAFVVMSLAASGESENDSAGSPEWDVVSKGVEFLVRSVRDDGSWPIDTNLATWVTTLSVNALAAAPEWHQWPADGILPASERDKIRRMLLESQYRCEHPYTHAAPGGWAWTALPGAVPDADDTAGALIALRNLGPPDEAVTASAVAGIKWLLGLQNSDGGIPTFCRGWTNLPFDRSAPDLTAHALAALAVWADSIPPILQGRVGFRQAIGKGLDYLERAQRKDGSWVPLWFGNQSAPNQENPVYGTAKVLTGLHQSFDRLRTSLPSESASAYAPMLEKAVSWLLSAQNPDGGWGGDKSVASSIEETALAVDALAESLLSLSRGTFGACPPRRAGRAGSSSQAIQSAVSRGVSWLIEHTGKGTSVTASPIGLYFARLWYFEDLYPVIFMVSALHKVKNLCGPIQRTGQPRRS